MCGVIGYAPVRTDEWSLDLVSKIRLSMDRLVEESSIRGLHSFGFSQFYGPSGHRACYSGRWIDVKGPRELPQFRVDEPAVAHWRYSTSGDWREERNNQPLVLAGVAAVAFNGVIHMGTREEFSSAFGVECESDNDGEVFLRRMAGGQDPLDFLKEISGSFAGVWLEPSGRLRAMRNERRPLWRVEHLSAIWFASTRDIFIRAGFPEPREVAPGVLEETS